MPKTREELLRGALNTLHAAISDADQIENELRRLNAKLLSVDLRLDSVDEAIVRVGIIRSNIIVRQGALKGELNEWLAENRAIAAQVAADTCEAHGVFCCEDCFDLRPVS